MATLGMGVGAGLSFSWWFGRWLVVVDGDVAGFCIVGSGGDMVVWLCCGQWL
jgi:hypothetical protein